nr:YfiR family protein [Prolixibacteraceae bacterium]
MKAIIKYLFLIIICSPLILNAQVERASLIGAYTYNFAKYTFWPNEDLKERFKIVIISDSEDVIAEFETFAKTRKIKDKTIDLEVFHTLPDSIATDVRMIILTNEQFDIFYKINQLIKERPVLLVSENFNEQRNVMINLFNTSEQKLVFEVNKANIL